jgi:hypothetical protein
MTDFSQVQPPVQTAADPITAATSAPVNSYVDTYTPPVTPITTASAPSVSSEPAGLPAFGQPSRPPLNLGSYSSMAPSATATPNFGLKTDQSLPAMNTQNMPAWQSPATKSDTAEIEDEPSTFQPLVASSDSEISPRPGVTPNTGVPPVSPVASSSTSPSQALEDQNIFTLLGIDSAKEEEKETFLDEIQEVIWQDFLETDLELLVTQDEMAEFKKIQAKPGIDEDQRQSEMIEFLEKLIPDLEKIMLEKALELKEEMVRERVKDMANVFASNARIIGEIDRARELMDDNQWREAANVLNAIRE